VKESPGGEAGAFQGDVHERASRDQGALDAPILSQSKNRARLGGRQRERHRNRPDFLIATVGPPLAPGLLAMATALQRERLGRFRPCCRFRSLHLAFWLLLSFARDALVHFLAMYIHFRLSAPTRRGTLTTGQDLPRRQPQWVS
jgi:hypothetical protein